MQQLLDLVLASLEGRLPDDPLAAYHDCAARGQGVDLALIAVAEQLRLDPADVLMARLALAVEEDLSVNRQVATLQAPMAGSRPTVGLLAKLLTPFGRDGTTAVAHSGAFEVGLVGLTEPTAPLVERPVAMPGAVLRALRGRESALDRTQLDLGDELQALAHQHGHALIGSDTVLVVRSPHPAEARAAALAVARAAGCRTLWLDGPAAGVPTRCALADAWPVLSAATGPSGHTVVPRFPRWAAPVLVVAGVDGTVEGADGRPLLTWRVPVPSAQSRTQLWHAKLQDPADAEALGPAHRHRAGRIHDLAAMACTAARVAGRDQPTADDVHQVAREGHEALGKLAQLLPHDVGDDALVLPDGVRNDLAAFLARARHREQLTEGLGAATLARYATGLRVLLVGPSGTGKTMAVSWLATKLGLPLFRVDLASVVSKYIGETEQNLAELLARAEASEVLLFFDEADSLFGKRTEVQQSTDRYANAQTNYLLQRIESYEGIVVLASNSRGKFDTAFSRRLDLIVQFPNPAPTERLALWRAHLGDTAISAQELNLLAASSDLAGGHVRNAVLAGAVRAQDAGRTLRFDDLVEGLRMEYRKLGKTLPTALSRAKLTNGAAPSAATTADR
ncbi:MAG: ATP-binding protein [Myxococcales bacterium]|nr:ATP-binding protein [Myxococcales bacterium]